MIRTARRLAASGAVWAGVEAGASAVLSFVSAFVVARLVGPREVGVGAAAVALHVLLWVPVNALFADALVQMPRVTRRAASSAFWAASAVGVLGAGVELAFAPVLASAVGDPRLAAMSCVLAAALPPVGAGGAVQGLLTRERRYRMLAGRTLIGQGIGTAAGVALAFAGAGAWALVLQQAATSLAGALTLLLRGGFRPRAVWRGASVLALLRLGLPLTASTLTQQGRYRLFAMVIGATAGTPALGQIHMAFRLIDTVRDLVSSALWRLAFPVMSRVQRDAAALQASVDRILALSGLLVFPLIGALALTISPAILLLLGPAWEPAAQASRPLLLLMVYVFLSFPGGVATVARGRPSVALAGNLLSAALMLAGVLLLRPATPAAAGWIWAGAQLLVAPYSLLATARALGARPGRQWRAGVAPLLLAAVATGAGSLVPALPWGPGATLAVRVAGGGAIYVLTCAVLLRGRVADAVGVLLPPAGARA